MTKNDITQNEVWQLLQKPKIPKTAYLSKHGWAYPQRIHKLKLSFPKQ